MNYRSILNLAVNTLKKKSIKNPLLDCEILLSKILNISRENLLLNLEKEIGNEEINKFNLILEKRKKKEPVAYILGKKEFWKTDFVINNSVLIPRPDTEILIEQSLKQYKNNNISVLDIGTGSGCILISLLKEKKKWFGTGIDLSKEAIKLAKINAKIQHVENRITFVHSDIDKFFVNKYDLIISNPPYISRYGLGILEEDVKKFEPKIALDGGRDGFSEIRKIVRRSSELIKIKGKLMLEIGVDQFYKSSSLLIQHGFYINQVSKDLAGKKRCIMSTKI